MTNRMICAAMTALLLGVALSACDDSCLFGGTDSCGGFEVSRSHQPGEALAEGGELRHERVRISGSSVQTWLQAYQYKGRSPSANAPFPSGSVTSTFHGCVDERDPASATWPFKPIIGATYLELPIVEISGPGIDGALTVAKTEPPNTIGNTTFRAYDFTYGGGAADARTGFNATLTPAMSLPGGEYAADIGDGDPMSYYLPTDYDAPLGIGSADAIVIPADGDLVLAWDAPPNHLGTTNPWVRDYHYSYVLFADPAAEFFPPQFMCFADAPGHIVIPEDVIGALPPTGIIMHGSTTLYMEARDADGEMRRFDLVGSILNISNYAIE